MGGDRVAFEGARMTFVAGVTALAVVLCIHALGVEAALGIFLALWANNIAERVLR